jgi:sialate O-acetylesterase
MKRICFTLFWLVLLPQLLLADVQLPPIFSNSMVLQRDIPVPIWGTAAPEEEVTVAIANQKQVTKAKADGTWRVTLQPLQVGEPLTVTVSGKNTIQLTDVLVGEVWVGSGQSNMAGSVKGYTKSDAVLAEAAKKSYPQIRLMHIPSKTGWKPATPENNDGFSAIHFGFGVKLQEELKVPVGLMYGAVGGTPSGFWLTEDMYKANAACQAQATAFAAKYNFAAVTKKYEADLAKWQANSEEDKKKSKAPPKPDPAGGVRGGKFGYLYEAHIRPAVTYGIRGVLWDQGESGTAINGVDQYNVMGALIKGWRKDWGQDFAFLYVQKPSGQGCAWNESDPLTSQASKFAALPKDVPPANDAKYRELHIRIAEHANTAMVISSDLGAGIHPTNKSGYGARAARVALGKVYGKPVEYYGPVCTGQTIEGNKIRLKFSHVGQGLAPRHADQLQGFAIAGEDKKFVWAAAVIDGDTILVSSDKVTTPVAVRYAWGGNHAWANLFNKDGLPAQTFRTDSWE